MKMAELGSACAALGGGCSAGSAPQDLHPSPGKGDAPLQMAGTPLSTGTARATSKQKKEKAT